MQKCRSEITEVANSNLSESEKKLRIKPIYFQMSSCKKSIDSKHDAFLEMISIYIDPRDMEKSNNDLKSHIIYLENKLQDFRKQKNQDEYTQRLYFAVISSLEEQIKILKEENNRLEIEIEKPNIN